MKNFIIKLQDLHLFLIEKDGELIINKDKEKFNANPYDFAKDKEEIIPFLKANKQEIIAYLKEENQRPKAIYKLSPLQEGLLFHKLYDENSVAYVDQLVVDLSKKIDIELFKSSWDNVLKNHSILRSCFLYKEFRIPVQCVYEKITMPSTFEDYSNFSQTEQSEKINTFLKLDLQRGFDFDVAPLLRVAIIKLSESDYKMVFTSHHIIIDGWSLSILIEEFIENYQNLEKGNSIPERKEEHYEDYIKYISNQDVFEEEKFWKTYLNDVENSCLLPFSKTTSSNKKIGENAETKLLLNSTLTEELKTFAQKHRLTVNTLVQGAWAILLSKYTGDTTTTFGVTVSGRPSELERSEDRVGLYINTLPLVSKYKKDETIASWLAELQSGHIQCREHQYMNLADIQKLSGVQGDLFDSILVFENYPISEAIKEEESILNVSELLVQEQTNYPFTIDVNFGGEELHFHFSYSKELFDEDTVERIQGHLKTVLCEIVAPSNEKLSDITMLTQEEKLILLGEKNASNGTNFNPEEEELNNNLPINVHFEKIVEANVNKTAIIHNSVEWTYEELNSYANQIAHQLRAVGIKEEQCVGVYLERSAEFVSTMMGIIKSGGVYTPIDTQNPASRVEKMLLENSFEVLITTASLLKDLPKVSVSKVIVIDEVSEELMVGLEKEGVHVYDCTSIEDQEVTNPENNNRMNGWAYILFTSGSTGAPKGAITCHDGAMNHLLAEYKLLNLPDGFRFLQSAGIGSDISVWQILGPLLKGGACVIVDKFELLDYERLLTTINKTNVSLVEFVPTYMWGLLSYIKECPTPVSLKGLQWIMLVGEAIPAQLVNDLRKLYPTIKLLNAYGPCEASDDVIQYEITANLEEESRVPIGKVIPNMNVAILNSELQLCPIGVSGEICVSGVGVGAGYIGLPERTAQSFISNPYPELLGDVMYKTGDMGRWLPDGNIEFLGREDHQVKIRGHRVELEGIASTLRKAKEVEDCHVLVHKNAQGEELLLCFVVLNTSGIGKDESSLTPILHELCQQELPTYMHPSQYCILEELPQNLSDKVDRKKLLKIYNTEFSGERSIQINNYVAPRNELEEQLITIWQELLGVSNIGVYDNFFELGGHSLLATRLVSNIRRELKFELAIKDVFIHATIADLGNHLETKSEGALVPDVIPQKVEGQIPLSFSQERLWFLDQLQGSLEYHIPVVLRLKGDLDETILEESLKTIVDRHQILRTVIKSNKGFGYQDVIPSDNWKLSTITSKDEVEAKEEISNFLELPFDLSTDYMLRASVYNVGEKEYLLAIVFHHIASDGWSENILVSEFVELYNALKTNRNIELPNLSLQYSDYAIWQRKYVEGDILEKQLTYWENKLKGSTPLLLPTDFARPSIQSTEGSSIEVKLSKDLSDSINKVCQKEGVTLFMLLLSAFKVLLYRYSGQSDICVGTPIANRTQSNLEDMIGFFVNSLTLRSNLEGNPTFKKVLQLVKTTTLEGYDNQLAPFEKVVDRVVNKRDMSMPPLFQVLFILQNAINDEKEISLADLDVSEYDYKEITSQFDVTLNVEESDLGIFLNMGYCTKLFKKETVENMLVHYQELLKSIVKNTDQSIGKLSMLTSEEEERITNRFNNRKIQNTSNKNVIDIFQDQVSQKPNSIALDFKGNQLSYLELDQKSNQIAHYLQKKGVKQNDIVGICIERSLEMIVGILGILKAGAGYVPIDHKYPQTRINFIIEDTGVDMMLTNSNVSSLVFKNPIDFELIKLDEDWGSISKEPTKLTVKIVPEHTSYVIYTSGSTGTPKGVKVAHKNLTNLVGSRVGYYGKLENMLLIPSFVFDPSVAVIFDTLTTGGRLIIPTDDSITDSMEMKSILKGENLDAILCSTSYYDYLLTEGVLKETTFKRVVLGGESLSKNLVSRHYEQNKNVPLFNEYGPTESTVWSTVSEIAVDEDSITIGKPIANTQVYILDTYQNLVPVKSVGELYIGGAGLTEGYLNQEELTKEKFIESPFVKGERLYKTGDLGRWLENGSIEFIGRIDDQVKIRGYRIELGEVEKAVMKESMVDMCCVLAKEDNKGIKRLVGYVVAKDFDRKALQKALHEKLPEYMIPQLWVELDSIPMTNNGKIDKKALLDPEMEILSGEEYVAPRNETEFSLVSIWQTLLGIEKIGVLDSFFELGGHSLLVTRLVSLIRENLNVEIAIKDVFEYNTIEELASYIEFIQLKHDDITNTEEYKVTIDL